MLFWFKRTDEGRKKSSGEKSIQVRILIWFMFVIQTAVSDSVKGQNWKLRAPELEKKKEKERKKKVQYLVYAAAGGCHVSGGKMNIVPWLSFAS